MNQIHRVHLVFKTHLDIGFTDLARNVVAQYFECYIPRAIALAEELAQAGGAERFCWTTGSWLIYEYLEQAAAAERARMEAAITAGTIAWHGLPFTTHTELMDVDLFRFGLGLSQALGRRFGKHTIAAKMTDVPGHTRGIVPLLAEAGIEFLHIGVNPASMPPAVPPVFRWRDPSGSEVVVMIHKGSYGKAMAVPGAREAIWFAHTNDNLGPQSPDQVRDVFRAARRRFPGAEILASTMDAFSRSLAQVRDQLPVVTDEIGDTWVHGVGTDPKKVSQFRQLLRLRRQWFADGRATEQDEPLARFNRSLLMVPEHTWGLDIKTHLNDFGNYSAEDFRAARSGPSFQKVESSWAEQRAYIADAVGALGASTLGQEAARALQEIEPAQADTSGMEPVPDPHAPFETARFRIAFDERGAVVRLADRASGREWASPEHPLGLFRYETFSQDDYARYYRQYIVNKRRNEIWAIPDMTKPGMSPSDAVRGEWPPHLERLFHIRDESGQRFIAILSMPAEACAGSGCPRNVIIEVTCPDDQDRVGFDVQWFDKPASRLPEAIWLSFSPRIRKSGRWMLDKLGQWVSPLEVVRNGNRRLHAVGSGVAYEEPQARLFLETLDAPLVAPGERSLLDFHNRQLRPGQGMHWLLYNNVWGTNFPMWTDEDARFRFSLHLERAG